MFYYTCELKKNISQIYHGIPKNSIHKKHLIVARRTIDINVVLERFFFPLKMSLHSWSLHPVSRSYMEQLYQSFSCTTANSEQLTKKTHIHWSFINDFLQF